MLIRVRLTTKRNRIFKRKQMLFSRIIASDIVQKGWKVLVAKLGLQKATQFVVLLERGKGDSVTEIRDYWGNASIDEIYNRITDWKASQS